MSFVMLREGIMDHVADGRLSPDQYIVCTFLFMLANRSTGLWRGKANTLAEHFGDQYSLGQVRRTLVALEQNGYIKRFHTQGSKHSSVILVNRFDITYGELKGTRVNAAATTDWKAIAYEAGTDELGTTKGRQSEGEGMTKGRRSGIGLDDSPTCATQSLRVREVRESLESLEKDLSTLISDPSTPFTSQMKAAGLPEQAPEHKLAVLCFKLADKPKKHTNSVDKWAEQCRNILSENEADYELVRGAMKWAFTESDFWPPILIGTAEPMKFFCEKSDTIIRQFKASQLARKIAAKKAAPVTSVDSSIKQKAYKDRIASLYAMPGK